MSSVTIHAYQMVTKDAPLEKVAYEAPALKSGEALIEVAGCGVCHTDISFWHQGVPTRHELPLTLGHEISGVVVDGPDHLMGRGVIVPAVLSCGECELCTRGRSNICRQQLMPGNDFHGGFASHVVAPSRFLAPITDAVLKGHELAELAVIADAVSTPYQVVEKSELKSGDLAIIIGIGGVGIYGVQLARAQGATVLALDISQEKLDAVGDAGIATPINISGKDIKAIKKEVKAAAKELGAPSVGWKIFEMSGTKPGQELGYALLNFAGTLSVVGFTLDKLELRLSNLMAFDAKAIGTWGCRPELYPAVIDKVANGDVKIKPYTEMQPMSRINDVFEIMRSGSTKKRTVLIPDFE